MGAPRAGAVIVRENLATSETNLSTAEIAELLKKRFLEDDLRVGQWKFNNEVVGVLAFGAPKEFGKPSAQPFRQIVSTFRTPKPKPNKARR
jgi:hypothetical protein